MDHDKFPDMDGFILSSCVASLGIMLNMNNIWDSKTTVVKDHIAQGKVI